MKVMIIAAFWHLIVYFSEWALPFLVELIS